MPDLKPLTLYSIAFPNSPNPWKVAIILEELNIPYTITRLSMFEVKKKPFTDLNPNGRTPVIIDHNNGDFVLWESIAIIQYLIERYDTTNTLTYTTFPEKHLINQWLSFQVSGQGPYFGQAMFFTLAHTAILPTVQRRYRTEIHRILGVLDAALEGKQYLVGDTATIADLAFVPWHVIAPQACGEDAEWVMRGFPNVERWMGELLERESVKTVLGEKRGEMSKPLWVSQIPPARLRLMNEC